VFGRIEVVVVDVGSRFNCSAGFLGVWSVICPHFWEKVIETQELESHHSVGKPWGDASLCLNSHTRALVRGRRHPTVSVWALVKEGVAWFTWGTPHWMIDFIELIWLLFGVKMTTCSMDLRTAAL